MTYWEPAKWVARLRATMTGGGPVLLKINMEAGHGGAAGRFDRLEEVGADLRLRGPGNRGVRGRGGALGRMTTASFAIAETRPKKNLKPVGTGCRGPC